MHAMFSIFIEGTFSKKPPEFQQLLTVSFKEPLSGVLFPLVFMLMGKKATETYEQVLNFIKENYFLELVGKR